MDDDEAELDAMIASGDMPPELAALLAKINKVEEMTAKMEGQNSTMRDERSALLEHNATTRQGLAQEARESDSDELREYVLNLLGDHGDHMTPDEAARLAAPVPSSAPEKPAMPPPGFVQESRVLQKQLGARAEELEDEIAGLEARLAKASLRRGNAEAAFERRVRAGMHAAPPARTAWS